MHLPVWAAQDAWALLREEWEVREPPDGVRKAEPGLRGAPDEQAKVAEEVCSYQSVKVCDRNADFFYIALFFHYCKRKTCVRCIFLLFFCVEGIKWC